MGYYLKRGHDTIFSNCFQVFSSQSFHHITIHSPFHPSTFSHKWSTRLNTRCELLMKRRQLANYVECNRCGKLNSLSVGQEIIRLAWYRKVLNCVNKTLPRPRITFPDILVDLRWGIFSPRLTIKFGDYPLRSVHISLNNKAEYHGLGSVCATFCMSDLTGIKSVGMQLVMWSAACSRFCALPGYLAVLQHAKEVHHYNTMPCLHIRHASVLPYYLNYQRANRATNWKRPPKWKVSFSIRVITVPLVCLWHSNLLVSAGFGAAPPLVIWRFISTAPCIY